MALDAVTRTAMRMNVIPVIAKICHEVGSNERLGFFHFVGLMADAEVVTVNLK